MWGPWSNWERQVEFAGRLIATGFLPPNIKYPAQVIAIIMTGQELGLPPMQSLRQINVISGKPTMSAELMLAKMLKGGVTLRWIKTGEDGRTATLEGTRAHTSFTGSFTIEEATAAGLTTKDGWKKYPGAMLRARVISLVARVVAPDLISGMYIPEEMGAEVTADGTVINEATGAAAILSEVVKAPRVVVVGEPVEEPPTLADVLAGFKAATTKQQVQELYEKSKRLPKSLDGSLRLSQAWLEAQKRVGSTPEPTDV